MLRIKEMPFLGTTNLEISRGGMPPDPLEAERLRRSVLRSQLQFPFGTPLHKNPGYAAAANQHATNSDT